MVGEYRFLRTGGGLTAFAFVRIRSCPNEIWKTVFGSELEPYVRAIYGAALESGIAVAANAHMLRGGTPQLSR